jgi:hypothetical protein
MRERAVSALKKNQSVVYDATNLTRKSRKNIIQAVPAGNSIIGAVIWASIETCIQRDSQRDRSVGEAVIKRMVKNFQMPWYDEGFDSVFIERTEDTTIKYVADTIKNMDIPHDNRHHTLSVIDHCIKAASLLPKDMPEQVYWATLFHDVGKPYCKDFKNTKGDATEDAHYYGHQAVGAWIAVGLSNFNRVFAHPYTIWLISAHMEPYLGSKYFNNLEADKKLDLLELHLADDRAH